MGGVGRHRLYLVSKVPHDATFEGLREDGGCPRGGRGETTANAQLLEYAQYVDEHFIQKGRLGVATGQGCYTYPRLSSMQRRT